MTTFPTYIKGTKGGMLKCLENLHPFPGKTHRALRNSFILLPHILNHPIPKTRGASLRVYLPLLLFITLFSFTVPKPGATETLTFWCDLGHPAACYRAGRDVRSF